MKVLPYENVNAEFKPWTENYLRVAESLIAFIRRDAFEVIHIGSTAAMVGGKGIIDLSLLYEKGCLSAAVNYLKSLGFQDQGSGKLFPDERPRKDGAVIYQGRKYYIHIHAIENGSEEHKKQLKFREYMLANASARTLYEQKKQSILAAGITDQKEYGEKKSPFVKSQLNQI
ncbi:GrpB family protein [uncultured Desulfuromusa sp.]|uniref:GrpB family protein n=1 Tax=uncultured Desulfuromusa sp. TaxID=219183 RepID=UPI002AA90776|nr:GrpB family protein [uncultured Desulfuromusa sp.]